MAAIPKFSLRNSTINFAELSSNVYFKIQPLRDLTIGEYIRQKEELLKSKWRASLGGTVVKNPPANSGDTGSSPGLGRSHMQWNN